MFHVDEGLAGFYLLAVHEFAHGVDGRNGDAPLLAFLVELFFRVTATEFRDCPNHDLRIFTSECHLLEFRAGNRWRTAHPIHKPAPLFNWDDKDARVSVLRGVRVIKVGLFAFA